MGLLSWLLPSAEEMQRREAAPEPDPRRVNLGQIYNLLLPGLREMERHIIEDATADWRHPVKELGMWVDYSQPRLAIGALWKDGSKHFTYLTAEEWAQGKYGLFKEKVHSLYPKSYFDDEIVVAYEEPERW